MPRAVTELIAGMLGHCEEKRFSWEEVFKKMEEIEPPIAVNQVQNAELAPSAPSMIFKKEGKEDYLSSIKDLVGDKIKCNDPNKLLDVRMQITNLINQKCIKEILNNKDFFGQDNENKLLNCLYIILEAELNEDLEFYKKSQASFTNSQEKITQLKRNIQKIQEYREDLMQKFKQDIKAKKTKTSEDRAFEILLFSNYEYDIQLVRDWFREIIVNILKSKSVMENLSNESMKLKDLFLIFFSIMVIESKSIFKRPSSLNDEYHDPYHYREASNDLSRKELNQKVFNWVSSLV